MVGVFEIGPERVQIGWFLVYCFFLTNKTKDKKRFRGCLTKSDSTGLAQYSGDPKTEWHLDAHKTRESLLDAVANLPYKGGNTLTGTKISFNLNMFAIDFLPLLHSEQAGFYERENEE